MHPAARSLLLLAAILAVTGAAVPDTPEPPASAEALEENLRLLETWRKDPNQAAHLNRLHADLEYFWKLPAEERTRLRKLDQELHEQDPGTREHLWNVLAR